MYQILNDQFYYISKELLMTYFKLIKICITQNIV